MNKYSYTFIVLTISLFFTDCGKKTKEPTPDSNITSEENTSDDIIIKDPYKDISTNQFYELEESLESIQKQIDELKIRVTEYDYDPQGINYTEKLKQLIDKPPPAHKIILKNNTVIEGTIVKDLINSIMVITDVGQLNIDKKDIELIEDFILPVPDIVFIGNGGEQVFEDHYIFTGRVLNQGQRRGDFVRIIYQLWAENTEIINSDSIFIAGKEIMYKSGITTDTSLGSNQSAYFELQVDITNDVPISYITREIRWELYD